MAKLSAGLLMYRERAGTLEVLLVHPGGPLWRNRDAGVWSMPKGEVEPGEDPLAAACREFAEETGLQPGGPFLDLGEIKQKGGKVVRAWAFAGDCDPAAIKSNMFTMEWPPRSGCVQQFPEVDRAAFVGIRAAEEQINPAQVELLHRLEAATGGHSP